MLLGAPGLPTRYLVATLTLLEVPDLTSTLSAPIEDVRLIDVLSRKQEIGLVYDWSPMADWLSLRDSGIVKRPTFGLLFPA